MRKLALFFCIAGCCWLLVELFAFATREGHSASSITTVQEDFLDKDNPIYKEIREGIDQFRDEIRSSVKEAVSDRNKRINGSALERFIEKRFFNHDLERIAEAISFRLQRSRSRNRHDWGCEKKWKEELKERKARGELADIMEEWREGSSYKYKCSMEWYKQGLVFSGKHIDREKNQMELAEIKRQVVAEYEAQMAAE